MENMVGHCGPCSVLAIVAAREFVVKSVTLTFNPLASDYRCGVAPPYVHLLVNKPEPTHELTASLLTACLSSAGSCHVEVTDEAALQYHHLPQAINKSTILETLKVT